MKTVAWGGRDDSAAHYRITLALTRIRDFLVGRGVTSLCLPVYDPNRGKLRPRELYALVHVLFSETDIEVYLHKKKFI